MNKQILTIASIKVSDTVRTDGRTKLVLQAAGRGNQRCTVILNEGETQESLGLKAGVRVIYQVVERNDKNGEVYMAQEFTGLFDVQNELANDYSFQLELAKTQKLANAKAMSNPALAALVNMPQTAASA